MTDSNPQTVKLLLLVIATLFALLIAFGAAALSRHNGVRWANAIFHGGAAFAGSLTLALLVLNTVLGN
ncbi:hypothetical protein AB0I35_05980 [Nocardia sp. NPDC050378]|uniref:hypothetical protein n=1 Tax=Nocardia sp. NPDC050378 TaxID=3155400 RepID=UPI0034069B58